jgi:hypothetical protein
MESDVDTEGHFRVLWAGRPEDLPGGPQLTYGELGYTVTRDGAGDARELWPAAEDEASHEIEEVLALTTDGRTTRLGHLLAPLAVRYVVIPVGPSPGLDDETPEQRLAALPAVGQGPARLVAALARQTDLVRLSTVGGAIVYRNEAAAPARANVRLDELGRIAAPDSLLAATGIDLSRAVPVLPEGDRLEVAGPVVASGVLLAERYDDRWRAHGADGAIDHSPAFGVTNAYAVPEAADVRVAYAIPFTHRVQVVAQVLAWLAVVVWLRRRVMVGAQEHRPHGAVEVEQESARRRRHSLLDLAEAGLDDDELALPLSRRERRQMRTRTTVPAGERDR